MFATSIKSSFSECGRYLTLIVKYFAKKKYTNDLYVIDTTSNTFRMGNIQFDKEIVTSSVSLNNQIAIVVAKNNDVLESNPPFPY